MQFAVPRILAVLLLAAVIPPIPSWGQPWPIQHSHDHVQGLDVNADWFWISAVDRRTKTGWVWRVDRRTLQTAAERNITDSARYHPGGLQVSGGSLWVPVAEYRPHSSSRILELDPMTLAERRGFVVEDHIGSVATDGKSSLLGGNWDARKIYRWNMQGKQLAVVEFQQPLAVQDMKWIEGVVYAGGVGLGANKGQCLLARLDPSSLAVLGESKFAGDTCYTHEGMALFGGKFFYLPEDAPRSRIYSMEAPP